MRDKIEIPCRSVAFFGALIFTTRTFQNPIAQCHRKKKMFFVFFVASSPQPDPPRSLQLNPRQQKQHSQNLPAALTCMRYKEGKTFWRFFFFWCVDFHSHILPGAYTSMSPKKNPHLHERHTKKGKPCSRSLFLL